MAGHSKFANIKHKKEKKDAIKGKIFTIIGREIAVAVKAGGPNISTNSKLRDVINKAKANNMPNDTIEKSIKKASGNLEGINYETITYEGYGPKGTAIIVEVLTDNKNRSAANVRNAFTKVNGNMGTTGCVSFLFQEKRQIIIEKNKDIDADNLMMICLDAGAYDFIEEDEFFEIMTTPEDFSNVLESIKQNNINILNTDIQMIPSTYVNLTEDDDIKKMTKLLDLLLQDDDVKNVYHNWQE